MSGLGDVRSVSVPRSAVTAVHEHMRSVGREGYEGLGLWVGEKHDRHFSVRGAYIPAQRHIRTLEGICVVIDAAELHRLNVWLFDRKLSLLAQIHSHPGRAYHSTMDDETAVATAVGCLSLVVPNFAKDPFDLGRVAAYRLNAVGRWTEMRQADLMALVTIME